MRTVFFIIFFSIISNTVSSQFSKEIIHTDSSEIEIIRNSLYKITTEVYHRRDSIWYSVRFIEDSNQVKTEGWSDKNNVSKGIWHEYRVDGVWLNSSQHNPYKLIYNDSLYPFHTYLEKMKTSADSVIRTTYGETFFENNVEFIGGCYAYKNSEYLGDWSTPINDKPNNFTFSFEINFHSFYPLNQEIVLHLDSLGNLISNYDGGFERIPRKTKKNKFIIEREKMIAKLLSKNKTITDSTLIYEYTEWYGSNKKNKFNGYYRYNLAVKIGETIKEENHYGKTSNLTYYEYEIYSFNLWNSKLKNVFTQNTTANGASTYFPASMRWILINR